MSANLNERCPEMSKGDIKVAILAILDFHLLDYVIHSLSSNCLQVPALIQLGKGPEAPSGGFLTPSHTLKNHSIVHRESKIKQQRFRAF